jgi:transposase InsO family protein
MNQRLQFVAEYLTGVYSMTEIAAVYGISRRIGYYWVDRFQRDGHLEAGSRRPHTSPQATPAELVARIRAAREAHPSWGAGKLRAWLLRREPQTTWPCRDTIHEVLRRHGLVRQRVRRRPALHPPVHLTPPSAPNVLWTTDYKGEFRTGDGVWCYPFTLRDGCSRYVLRCTALRTHTRAVTAPEFIRAFRTFGLPDRIRSDNGSPFGASGLGRLSRLAVWWLRLGIIPERITPRHPEQNGSHEQFHAVLKRETTRPPAASCRAQQRRFGAFVAEYNHERPHEALGGQPPATVYRPSLRVYPERLPPLDYPAAWEVRRVSTGGTISWGGHIVFLTEVLGGEDVALEPVDDTLWLVRFGALPLARFDARRRCLLPLLPASAASAEPSAL